MKRRESNAQTLESYNGVFDTEISEIRVNHDDKTARDKPGMGRNEAGSRRAN